MRHWFKSKLLYKYIVSYLIVFLVPFFIMNLVIYLNSVSSLRAEIEQANINQLEQVETITNDRIKELEMLAARMSYDPRLTPYMLNHNYYSGEGIEELNKYKDNSAIVEELFVYYHQYERIYASTGTYSPGAFMRSVEWQDGSFETTVDTKLPLSNPVERSITSNEQASNLIAYSFPITPNSPRPYGTVVFLISEASMASQIDNVLGDFKGNAYIINENDQIIASTINDLDVSSEDLNLNAYATEDSTVQNIKINGKDYSLVSVQSPLNQWKFITLLDADQFFERLDNTTLMVVLLMLIILVIGLLLSIGIGRRQYQPIQNLFESIKTNVSKSVEIDGDNELEVIKRTVSSVFEDHELLNEKMDKQIPFAQDQFFTKLLKGDFTDEEEIISLADSLDVKMNGEKYFVSIVNFEKDQFGEEGIIARETIFSTLVQFELKGTVVHGVDLLYQDAVALIVNIDSNHADQNKIRKQLVSEIKQYIKDKLAIEPTICIGQSYAERKKINRSYIEALAAVEHKYFHPQGGVIYFEDISAKTDAVLGYPEEEQIRLLQSIKQGDESVAIETLDQIFEMLNNRDSSVHGLRAICYDIINATFKTIVEVEIEVSAEIFDQIAGFRTIEQLYEQLSSLIQDVCHQVDEKKESHNHKLKNDMLDYIKTNYKAYELSLEQIATEFNLSVSYISRFIKEQTGETFTYYVQKLRMDEVKRQLKETNKTIKDIVGEVGYKDVANFTRKFKKEFGMTPGQFRKLNK